MIAGDTGIGEKYGLIESHCCLRCFEEKPNSANGAGFPPLRLMIVCPDCGNKRCPKATFHENACTGSNATGQPGSRYQ